MTCARFNDVELFVDISSQAEKEQKKSRVDEQENAINVTRSSSPSQFCGSGALGAADSSFVPSSMMYNSLLPYPRRPRKNRTKQEWMNNKLPWT